VIAWYRKKWNRADTIVVIAVTGRSRSGLKFELCGQNICLSSLRVILAKPSMADTLSVPANLK